MTAERASVSENDRAAKRPDLERLRAAWAVAAEAQHRAERAAEASDSMRADRDAQSRFMAILAHELKNPLNAIYGYAQFLRQPEVASDAAGRQDKLATVEAAAKHLIGLVGDILTSEQIESENLEINSEPFEVAPLIEEVAALERAAIAANGNNLILFLPPDSGTITSDRRRVAQVLINLLSNAAKFTHKGEVAITVVRDEDNSLLITVTDTGAGIPPDRKAELFEAFSAIGGTEARKAGGHGLGLYITAGLVNRLSGSISVDSELGKGTRMTVWLPDLRTQRRPERPGESELLTMGFTQALPALDPLLQQVDADYFLIGSVFECLTEIGADGHAQPALARSWHQIDARTWMFRLDRSARFHNGDPVTAEDAIATFRRVRRMLDDPNCEMQSTTPDLEAFEAADEHTVVLRTRTPSPLFLEQLASVPIVHRSAGNLPVGVFNLAHAIGTGPYRLVDYGAHGLRLIAHPRPGKTPAQWKVVIGRRFRTAAEAENALMSGRVDVTPQIGRALARKLEQGSAIRVLRPKSDSVFFLQPNILPGARGMAWWPDGTPIDANPLADVRVRRALSLAIDRDFLVNHALLGGGEVLGSPVPAHFFGADPTLYPDPYRSRARAPSAVQRRLSRWPDPGGRGDGGRRIRRPPAAARLDRAVRHRRHPPAADLWIAARFLALRSQSELRPVRDELGVVHARCRDGAARFRRPLRSGAGIRRLQLQPDRDPGSGRRGAPRGRHPRPHRTRPAAEAGLPRRRARMPADSPDPADRVPGLPRPPRDHRPPPHVDAPRPGDAARRRDAAVRSAPGGMTAYSVA